MMFDVEYHPKAYKEYVDLLRMNIEIATEFREYLEALAEEPYQFPKKKGKLKYCRALSFKVKGNHWRLVFRIVGDRNAVEILAIGLHDEVYNSAERRL